MGEPLSILDTMFLELEQVDDTAHMHIGAALVFDSLADGSTPDLARLRARLVERLDLLPRFSQRLSAPAAGPLTWLTWEQVERIDYDAHMHHVALPAPGGKRELDDFLGDYWSHRLDRHRPLWDMTLLDGLEGGHWCLATKTHHCLVDGVGSLDIADALLDPDPDAPARPAAGAQHREHGHGSRWLTPSLLVRGGRAALGAARHPREAIDRLRSAADVLYREEVIGAPHTSLGGEMSGSRRFLSERVELADMLAAKDRLGGTLNDLVLAICAGGLRELLLARGETPPHGIRAQVPVNLRSDDQEHALGNELTSLFVELPVEEPDALARHARVRQHSGEAKSGPQRRGGKTIVDLADMGPPLAGEMLARSMFGGSRMFNLTITNVPGPRERRYALGAPMLEVLPLVPLFAEHAVGIAAFTYDGGMVFGINADRLGAPDAEVLAQGIRHSFAELCAKQPV